MARYSHPLLPHIGALTAAFPRFSDSWKDPYESPASARSSDTSIAFQNKGDENDEGLEHPAAAPTPFFFGSQRTPDASDERALPPLSRDPFAHYEASRSPTEATNDCNDKDDNDDAYFFGTPPSDSDAPAKATSWDEIRRRAAERPRK